MEATCQTIHYYRYPTPSSTLTPLFCVHSRNNMHQLKRLKEKAKRKLRIGKKEDASITDRESTGSALSFQSEVATGADVKGGDKGIGVKDENLTTGPDDPESAPQPGVGKGVVAGGRNDTGGGINQDDPGPHLHPEVGREATPLVHPETVNTESTPQGVGVEPNGT
jgi:hypothetical protein